MGIYSKDYQGRFLTVFYSGGAKPFSNWEMHISNGCIKRFLDPQLKTLVTDILSTNVTTTFMSCPKGKTTLGIYLPFLVMIVKNLKKYFAFEVTILDDSGWKRRFRVANFQSCTKVSYSSTAMPIGLADGWNQIQFNLCEFTRKAYNTSLVEVISLKINANIRIKRIYFAARLVPEEELPKDYRLFYPSKICKGRRKPSDHPVEVEREACTSPRFSKENALDQGNVPIPTQKEQDLKIGSFVKPTEEQETTGRKSIISSGSGSKKEKRSSVTIKVSSSKSKELGSKSQELNGKSQKTERKSEESVRRSKERIRKSLEGEKNDTDKSKSAAVTDRKDSQSLLKIDSQNAELKQVFRVTSQISNSFSYMSTMSTSILPKHKASESLNMSVPNISRAYKVPDIFIENEEDTNEQEHEGHNSKG